MVSEDRVHVADGCFGGFDGGGSRDCVVPNDLSMVVVVVLMLNEGGICDAKCGGGDWRKGS